MSTCRKSIVHPKTLRSVTEAMQSHDLRGLQIYRIWQHSRKHSQRCQRGQSAQGGTPLPVHMHGESLHRKSQRTPWVARWRGLLFEPNKHNRNFSLGSARLVCVVCLSLLQTGKHDVCYRLLHMRVGFSPEWGVSYRASAKALLGLIASCKVKGLNQGVPPMPVQRLGQTA